MVDEADVIEYDVCDEEGEELDDRPTAEDKQIPIGRRETEGDLNTV